VNGFYLLKIKISNYIIMSFFDNINKYKHLIIAALILFIIAFILTRFENFGTIKYDITNTGTPQTCTTKLQCLDKQDCINGKCLNIQPYCFTHGTTTDSMDGDPTYNNSQGTNLSWTCKGTTGNYTTAVDCGSQKVVMDDKNKYAYCQ